MSRNHRAREADGEPGRQDTTEAVSMATDQARHKPDSDLILQEFERQARHWARAILTSRLDSAMDPEEARESVKRWAMRAAAAVHHGADEGVRDTIREAQP